MFAGFAGLNAPGRLSITRGRTESPNAGSAMLAGRCLTISSHSTKAISDAFGVSIWPIIMRTARTLDSRRLLNNGNQSLLGGVPHIGLKCMIRYRSEALDIGYVPGSPVGGLCRDAVVVNKS